MFEINKYTVTFDNDGKTDDVEVEYGNPVAKPADPTKTGYTFVAWYLDGKAYDFETPVTGDITLVAEYKVNQYTISFDTNGGSDVASITQDYGSEITAPANPTKVGYTFKGWEPAMPATMPAKDMTVKAVWEINVYTVTFDNDRKTSDVEVEYGNPVAKPADPTKTGYTFVAWYLDGKAYDFATPVTGDITLVAQWKINTYAVTFNSSEVVIKNGTVTIRSGDEVPYGTELTVSIVDREGHTAVLKANGFIVADSKYTIHSNVEFTVDYSIISYTVSFDSDVTVKNDETELKSGDKIPYGTELTVVAKDSYGQDGHIFANDVVISGNAYIIKDDVEFTVKYTNHEYTVTYTVKNNTFEGMWTYGTELVVPEEVLAALNIEGHKFIRWSPSLDIISPDNLKFEAVFEIEQFQLVRTSIDTHGGNEVESVNYGDNVTIDFLLSKGQSLELVSISGTDDYDFDGKTLIIYNVKSDIEVVYHITQA